MPMRMSYTERRLREYCQAIVTEAMAPHGNYETAINDLVGYVDSLLERRED